MQGKKLYDVIIIGGGPAGLSAALILARCMRSVLVFDTGKPRNIQSNALHGLLSRDGINPLEYLRISKEQLNEYNIDFLPYKVINAKSLEGSFEILDTSGQAHYSRKILIATGLVDQIPKIDGIEKLYGKSVYHCPYCDGFENRLKPLAALGCGKSGVGLALTLSNWSDDVLLCTNGKIINPKERELLDLKEIKINYCKIDRLEGQSGLLKRIVFTNGSFVERNALFFSSNQYQKSSIGTDLGCKFTEKGVIKTNKFQKTSVSGVFAAGDAARDMQLVAIASADGVKAGVVINKELQKEESNLKFIGRFLDHW